MSTTFVVLDTTDSGDEQSHAKSCQAELQGAGKQYEFLSSTSS